MRSRSRSRTRRIALPKTALTVAAVIVLAMVSAFTVVLSPGGFGGSGAGDGGMLGGGSQVRQAAAQALDTAPFDICTRHTALQYAISARLNFTHASTYDLIRQGVADDPDTTEDESADPVECSDDADYGTVSQAHMDTIVGLDLSSAGILEGQLDANDFAGLRRVTRLDLSRNAIVTLPPGLFEGLERLETLNLSRNRIASLDRALFEDMDNVETIDLSHNELTASGLSPGVFGLLTDATSYDFGHNTELGPPNPLWFGPVAGAGIDLGTAPDSHARNIEFLGLANTGLDGDTFPIDLFDRFGDPAGNIPPAIRALDMSQNPNLHLVNTRWFERLVNLDGDGGNALQMWGSRIGRMFYNENSNYPPPDWWFGHDQPFQDRQRGLYTSDSGSPNQDASPDRLRTIILGAISDWAGANGFTSSAAIDADASFGVTVDGASVEVSYFAPTAVELYNICSRADKVRRPVIEKLVAEVAYYSGIDLDAFVAARPTASTATPSVTLPDGTTPTGTAVIQDFGGGGSGCPRPFRSVLVSDLNALSWANTDADRLDLSHDGSTETEQLLTLHPADLRGLTGIRGIDLSGNDLIVLPDGLFQGIELEYLDVSGNARLGHPDPDWFDETLAVELEVFLVNGTNIRGLELPLDTFTSLTGLKLLELKDHPRLDVINYRWFQGLTGLTGLDGGSGLRFQNSVIYRFFNSDATGWPTCEGVRTVDGNIDCNVPQGETGDLNFQYANPSAVLLAGDLDTYIGGSAAILNSDSEFRPEGPMVHTICNRPHVIRDQIAAKMAAEQPVWSFETLPSGNTCDSTSWGQVPEQELAMLVWDGETDTTTDGGGGETHTRNILDVSGTVPGPGDTDTRLTSLHQAAFSGLTGLQALDLSVNRLGSLPGGIFDNIPLKVLILRNNPDLGAPQPGWWLQNGDPGLLESLDLADTGLVGGSIAHDAFADFDGLKQLILTDNPNLGIINAKWFEAMPRLESVSFAGSVVHEYYYGTGTPANAEASADAMDDPVAYTGDASALAAYIESYIDAFPNPAHERDVADDAATDADETESREIVSTQQNFAPSTATLYDLCDRTDAVRDEILEKLKADRNLYDAQQVAQCAQVNGEILTTAPHLAALSWPDRAGRFDVSSASLTALLEDDFAGLTGLNALDISDNAITPNGLPEAVFAPSPIREFWAENNAELGYPLAYWFDPAQVGDIHRMIWNNTGIDGSTMPLDTFDAFTGLRKLELRRQNSLRFINTRWFERLTNLDHYDDSGRSGIRFRGSNVSSFFYDATVQTPATGQPLDYGPTSDATPFGTNAAALATAIETAINTWAAAQAPVITPDLQIDASDNQFPPAVLVTFNVCTRTRAVRDVIIDALRTDAATSGTFGSVAHTEGGAGCATRFTTVSSTELSLLLWPSADGTTRRTFDLRSRSLTDLAVGDFAGLTGMRSLDLSANALTNANLEPMVFGAGSQDGAGEAPLQSVVLSNNPQLNGVEAAWFTPEQQSTISLLDLANTGVQNSLAHDTFDAFGDLWLVSLVDNDQLTQINTRWFERLPYLRHAWFADNFVTDYYYDADGNVATGATPFMAAGDLGTAINTRINTWSAAQAPAIVRPHQMDTADARFAPNLSVDLCGRPKMIWAEVMFNMGLVDLTTTGVPSREDSYGDVRHILYRDLTCPGPFPAILVETSVGQPIQPGESFDAARHDRAVWNPDIRTFARLGRFRLDLSNADGIVTNGALNPADFENLYAVDELLLNSNLIDTIPASTFAQMPALKRLSLSNNRLENSDLSGATTFLDSLDLLIRLDLDGNLLTEFDSAWLSDGSRTNGGGPGWLDRLNVGNQPIKQATFANLDLEELRFDGTHLSTIDPAIATMENLEELRWNALAEQDADLHEQGAAAFFASLPDSLKRSLPGEDFGNRFGIEDEVVGREAVDLQMAHFRRLRELQGSQQQIEAVTLYDPCRRSVSASGGADAWAASGNLCLTAANRDEIVNALSEFDAVSWVDVRNGGLTDTQMNRLLSAVESNQMVRLQLDSNPDAFGVGYQDSWLNVFRNPAWDRLRYLSIQNNDINFAQVNTILGNLAASDGAFGDLPDQPVNLAAMVRFGLERLNLSHNPGLFDGVDPGVLDGTASGASRGFLEGIPQRQAVFEQPFELLLAETGLKFDQLVAIIDSIDEPDTITEFAQQVRLLDVSDNPDLWEKVDGTRASAAEITGLFERMKGLTGLDISNTGLMPSEFPALVDGINDDLAQALSGMPPDARVGMERAQERMELLSLGGLDLTSVTGLRSQFVGFNRRTTSLNQDTLQVLDLSDTSLDTINLGTIANALSATGGDEYGAKDKVAVLDLSGNPMLLDACASNRASFIGALAVFTNVRHIHVNDGTVGSFEELDCLVAALEQMDGVADGGAPWIATLSFDDNPNALIRSNPGPATAADVLALSRRVPNAMKSFGGTTAVTIPQARALLQPSIDGLPVEAQESAGRVRDREIFAKYNTRTPAPSRVAIESGQTGVRVIVDQVDSYTAAGATISVDEYEYRFRERGDNPERAWTGPEADWQTVTVGTRDDGMKEFDIGGLEPSTSYQVEVRSTSDLPTSAATRGSGGTLVGLPIVLRVASAITSVSIRAGDSVRLAVDVYDRANRVDNALSEKNDGILVFQWSADGGGSFGNPNDEYRVVYTAPSSPGTYTVRAEAGPDGVCLDHHEDEFGITEAQRASCIAQFTVLVTRAAAVSTAVDDAPVNPAGVIPSSLVDTDGVQYSVFTPEEGGQFDGDDIVVTADAGAVPDRQLLGVAASRSDVAVPDAQPGARVTFAGSFYDIMGVQRNGDRPVAGFRLDEALTVCVPMPNEFGGNLNDVALVSRDDNGVVGVLSSSLRQVNGALSVCGKVSLLPATVAVAKVGLVPELEPEIEVPGEVLTPDTGGTAPGQRLATMALAGGVVLLLLVAVFAVASVISRTVRRRSTTSSS